MIQQQGLKPENLQSQLVCDFNLNIRSSTLNAEPITGWGIEIAIVSQYASIHYSQRSPCFTDAQLERRRVGTIRFSLIAISRYIRTCMVT